MRATRGLLRRRTLAGSIAASLLLTACSGGSGASGDAGPTGPAGPPGPGSPFDPEAEYKPLPGVAIVITSVTGGSGPGGQLQSGDTPTVRFTLKDNAGTDLDLADMTFGEIYVSGPSFNYQRVLFGSPTNFDPRSALFAGSSTWQFTFPAPIPATYLPPFNDTASFGTADGEMTGQPLLDGTYTVGMTLGHPVTVGAKTYDDVGAATGDFLFGSAATIDHREVIQNDNCNVCHTELRVHDGRRKDVRLCVLCHTSGAEDSNVSGATPGVTIAFKVMVHRIHNGEHLPSVLGITTNPDGSRNLAATPVPLQFADDEGGVADFSDVGFPVWPNLNVAMPKSLGYSALSSTDPDGSGPLLSPKARDDTRRTGVTACVKCHGDPDAGGPLSPPSQGGICYSQPSMQVCGSCHDDIDWTKLRRPGQALEHARRACELDGGNAWYRNTLGVACFRAGEFEQSVTELTAAANLARGGGALDHFFLAMALHELGETAAARDHYAQAVENSDPGDRELERVRTEAFTLLGLPESER